MLTTAFGMLSLRTKMDQNIFYLLSLQKLKVSSFHRILLPRCALFSYIHYINTAQSQFFGNIFLVRDLIESV